MTAKDGTHASGVLRSLSTPEACFALRARRRRAYRLNDENEFHFA